MGRLKEMRAELAERRAVVADVEARLCALQSKYETFFAEVARAREEELRQLVGHATGDPAALPAWLVAELEAERIAVSAELAEQAGALAARRREQLERAEALRLESVSSEQELRQQNAALDQEEESLKARSAGLLARIADYNRRIRALGSGFGFFANFFGLRRLARERAALDREQADVAARVDGLRRRWEEASTGHAAAEADRRAAWAGLETEAAALAAKLEALATARPAMVTRSAVERVLDRRQTRFATPAGGTPCPRCQMPNPAAAHFCHVCALRLTPDRPDLAGSVEEVAELNHHFRRFQDGVRACQEIIGLVRGIGSGLDAFAKSVDDMIASERKYPLPKLDVDMPQAARAWATNLDSFREAVCHDLSLHPQHFSGQVKPFVDQAFTPEAIQAYFECMGAELTRCAEEQWK